MIKYICFCTLIAVVVMAIGSQPKIVVKTEVIHPFFAEKCILVTTTYVCGIHTESYEFNK